MPNWVERLKTDFSIKMGDGSVFKPRSFNANKSTPYNIAEFTFRNLSGTLVDKRLPMGTVYRLELYFEGPNNIDEANRFQTAANDPGRWTITHPFYDKLLVQPITDVDYDNANNLLNVTKITVTVRECIDKKHSLSPTNIHPPDVITALKVNTDKNFAAVYVSEVPTPKVADVEEMQSTLDKFKDALRTVQDTGGDILNAYNKTYAAINAAADDVESAITDIQDFLNLPVTIADSIANRTLYILGELDTITAMVADLELPSLKDLWFLQGGTCMGAVCLSAVTNIDPADYQYSYQVLDVIGKITAAYNGYLANLDRLQTASATGPDSWNADPGAMASLDYLVNFTLSTLFDIQANAKQPKYVTLTKDSNVMTIAWNLYGLVADDSTIDKLIADNGIYGDELVQVLKGRRILYY